MKLDRVIAVRNKKTIYRDGDRCIKVFNEDYSKADVLNEALNQARVEETGLPIPKLIEVKKYDDYLKTCSDFLESKFESYQDNSLSYFAGESYRALTWEEFKEESSNYAYLWKVYSKESNNDKKD